MSKWDMDLQLFGDKPDGDQPAGGDKPEDKSGQQPAGGDKPEDKSGQQPSGDKPAGEKPTGEETVPKAYADRVRREKADLEKELKALKDKEAEREREEKKKAGQFEQLAEEERQRRVAAEQKLTDEIAKRDRILINAELKAEAVSAGILDTDTIVLADIKDVKVEDDSVLGVKEAVAALKASKPQLFKKEGSGGGGRQVPPASSSGDKAPTDATKLSDEDFDKLWNRTGTKSKS